MRSIAQTGFFVSILSYALFAVADYWRPGFVSYHFSVHWWLLAVIIFGGWWAKYSLESDKIDPSRLIAWPIKLATGALLFVILWEEGGVFGDFRIVLALVGLLLPWLVAMLLSKKEVNS